MNLTIFFLLFQELVSVSKSYNMSLLILHNFICSAVFCELVQQKILALEIGRLSQSHETALKRVLVGSDMSRYTQYGEHYDKLHTALLKPASLSTSILL